MSANDAHLLGGDFCVHRITTVAHSESGYQAVRRRESLLAPPDGERRPNAGLLQAMCCLPKRDLTSLSVRSEVPLSHLVCQSASPPASPANICQFIARNTHGIIRTAKSLRKADIIREISRGFPDARIVFVANRVKDLRAVADELSARRGSLIDRNRVQCISGRQPLLFFDSLGHLVDGHADDTQPFPHLACCTPLQLNELEPSSIDIVIVLDAAEVVTAPMRTALCKNDAPFRLFAFAGDEQVFSEYEDAHVSAAFGFSVLDVFSRNRVKRPAFVQWTDNHQHRIIAEHAVGYPTILHNERRNRRIKQVAKYWSSGGDGVWSVSIVVDRIEHALTLGKMLPTWRIVTDPKASLEGFPGSQRRRIKRDCESVGDGKTQIVMSDVAHKTNIESDVIIWAAGGCAANIPASWLARCDQPEKPVLIVDFLDKFNPKTAEFAGARKRAYARNDIFEQGVSPQEGRARRFVDKYWRPQ